MVAAKPGFQEHRHESQQIADREAGAAFYRSQGTADVDSRANRAEGAIPVVTGSRSQGVADQPDKGHSSPARIRDRRAATRGIPAKESALPKLHARELILAFREFQPRGRGLEDVAAPVRVQHLLGATQGMGETLAIGAVAEHAVPVILIDADRATLQGSAAALHGEVLSHPRRVARRLGGKRHLGGLTRPFEAGPPQALVRGYGPGQPFFHSIDPSRRILVAYNKDTTTNEVLEGIDLSGKRIVVTGSSSGLGEESTRALASKGAKITMAARNPEKNEAAAARVREKVPGAELELRELDLASLDSVRRFTDGFLSDNDEIDVLLNNAGVMCCPQGKTSDGFESQLGTNHIGHFLLTARLAPALIKAESSRVVVLSSGAHGICGMDFDDPMFERRAYDEWTSYGQSKTANALFAMELDRRMSPKGVQAYAVHPGVIMTELARHLNEELMTQMIQRQKERAEQAGESSGGGLQPKSVEAGAATQVWAATAPELAAHGGAYLGDCQLAVLGGNVGANGVEPHARDPKAAVQLWEMSENWVGESFSA